MRQLVRMAASLLAMGALWCGAELALTLAGSPAIARAAEDWKKEFEDICAKTQDAMALSTEELKSLVARCDALKPAVDALDESMRKVYSRRLKACRDLYQYVIDYRVQGQG